MTTENCVPQAYTQDEMIQALFSNIDHWSSLTNISNQDKLERIEEEVKRLKDLLK